MLIADESLETAPTTALAAALAISPPTIAELLVLSVSEYTQSSPTYTPSSALDEPLALWQNYPQ